MVKHKRGIYNMVCFNGLSPEQQTRLVVHGNLPIGYMPQGPCPNGADCGIETQDDAAPGPRFYCYSCAAEYLTQLSKQHDTRTDPGTLVGQAVDHALDVTRLSLAYDTPIVWKPTLENLRNQLGVFQDLLEGLNAKGWYQNKLKGNR